MSKGPWDTDPDLEHWLLDTWPLTDREKGPVQTLLNCVGAADYSIRNAGNLDTADDLRPAFQDGALEAATILQLSVSLETFRATRQDLTDRWYDTFDALIAEIRLAWSRITDPWPYHFGDDDVATAYLAEVRNHPWADIKDTISAYIDDQRFSPQLVPAAADRGGGRTP